MTPRLALTLRWDDLDRTAGEFRLRSGKTGARMMAVTPMAARVRASIPRQRILGCQLQRSNLATTESGHPLQARPCQARAGLLHERADRRRREDHADALQQQ